MRAAVKEQLRDEAQIKCYLFRRWMRREIVLDDIPPWMSEKLDEWHRKMKANPVDDWGNPR